MFTVLFPGVLASAITAASPAIVPNLGEDSRFQWVGPTGGASGTAVARRSVITAKHVGGSTYGVLGKIYSASYRIHHPTMDLAILVFGEDLPGWHEIGGSAPVGSEVMWVGYGRTGILNPQGTGYDIYWWSGGTRLAAPNQVDLEWYFPGWGPSLISYLKANGDAAAVSGDSGGGVFVGDKLVGVISYAFNSSNGVLPDYGFASLNNGVPYHGSGAISLTDPEVRRWLMDNLVPYCRADFDLSGFVDTDDYDQFVHVFEAGEDLADFDRSGFVDFEDFTAFVRAFEDGC